MGVPSTPRLRPLRALCSGDSRAAGCNCHVFGPVFCSAEVVKRERGVSHTTNVQPGKDDRRLRRERWALLASIIRLTEQPMIVLSFAWVVLVVVDLARGLTTPLLMTTNIIWVIFIVDFLIKLIIAPSRLMFVRKHWITAASIALPAFRVLQAFRFFRLLRLFRAGGAFNLLRLLASTRRGMQALAKTLGRRGFGYVVAMTALVIFLGAAGMLYFENPASLVAAGYEARGLRSYAEAIWWTAMIMTTMGSDYWPQSPEGRVLCWMLALYAFTVFGYITATIASHFILSDQQRRVSTAARS
jgi:voltage-gated potassium channel